MGRERFPPRPAAARIISCRWLALLAGIADDWHCPGLGSVQGTSGFGDPYVHAKEKVRQCTVLGPGRVTICNSALRRHPARVCGPSFNSGDSPLMPPAKWRAPACWVWNTQGVYQQLVGPNTLTNDQLVTRIVEHRDKYVKRNVSREAKELNYLQKDKTFVAEGGGN